MNSAQQLSSFWSSRRVFVTGASGLLGPWLAQALVDQGAQVYALTRDCVLSSRLFSTCLRDRVNLVYGDLKDRELLERVLNEFDIDVVFHLGAQALVPVANRSPLSTFESNVAGTWNLLEACRLSPWVKSIVVASSDKAYGQHAALPYTEDAPLQGRYPYDVSKSCADLIAQSYAHTYKLPVAITRCGNFFGGGDVHFSRIVPGTIKALLNYQAPVIRSNGMFIRDYIYVKDVVSAYLCVAQQLFAEPERLTGQAFNFSTDQPLTVLQIVHLIMDVMACSGPEPIVLGQAIHEIPAQHLSSHKAHAQLGWQPIYGVRKGLEETVEWYRRLLCQRQGTYEKDLYHPAVL